MDDFVRGSAPAPRPLSNVPSRPGSLRPSPGSCLSLGTGSLLPRLMASTQRPRLRHPSVFGLPWHQSQLQSRPRPVSPLLSNGLLPAPRSSIRGAWRRFSVSAPSPLFLRFAPTSSLSGPCPPGGPASYPAMPPPVPSRLLPRTSLIHHLFSLLSTVHHQEAQTPNLLSHEAPLIQGPEPSSRVRSSVPPSSAPAPDSGPNSSSFLASKRELPASSLSARLQTSSSVADSTTPAFGLSPPPLSLISPSALDDSPRPRTILDSASALYGRRLQLLPAPLGLRQLPSASDESPRLRTMPDSASALYGPRLQLLPAPLGLGPSPTPPWPCTAPVSSSCQLPSASAPPRPRTTPLGLGPSPTPPRPCTAPDS